MLMQITEKEIREREIVREREEIVKERQCEIEIYIYRESGIRACADNTERN